jgi:hypothetical protein
VKTAGADVLAQCHLEGKHLADIDRRRTLVFFTWGAVYLGGVQYFIYVHLFSRVLFPSVAKFVAKPMAQRLTDVHGQLTVLKQVALDQFVHHPFVLFPCFYCVKEGIERGNLEVDTVKTALAKYRANMVSDCVFCWQWWVPTFLLNFSIAPLHMRVPITAAVSFAFTSLFSLRRGARQELQEEQGR